jgi:hypothetical protein
MFLLKAIVGEMNFKSNKEVAKWTPLQQHRIHAITGRIGVIITKPLSDMQI